MRFLIVGDTHYKDHNAHDTSVMEKEIDRLIMDNNPKTIVFLGDTLDDNKRLDSGAQQRAQNYMIDLTERYPDLEIILLIGNHDRYNNQDFLSEKHPFSGMEKRKNVTVVYDVVLREYGAEDERIRVCYVPYVPPGRFMEAVRTKVESSDIETIDLFFGHQDFKPVVPKGDDWDHMSTVISGHYHKKYYVEGERIIYPGAPLTHAFGDDEERFVLIYDINVENNELTENPKFCKINVPVRRELRIDVPMDSETVARVKKFLNETDQIYARIHVTGTTEEIDNFKRSYSARCSIMPHPIISITERDEVADVVAKYKFKDLVNEELDVTEDEEENGELIAALKRVRLELGLVTQVQIEE